MLNLVCDISGYGFPSSLPQEFGPFECNCGAAENDTTTLDIKEDTLPFEQCATQKFRRDMSKERVSK